MHTLFDFTTYVKGIEYILALGSIAGYILFWEMLKPRPFKTLKEVGGDDIAHIKREGIGRSLANLAKAPLIGVSYLAMVPVAFAQAVGGSAMELGWSPVRAYFAGRKSRSRKSGKK